MSVNQGCLGIDSTAGQSGLSQISVISWVFVKRGSTVYRHPSKSPWSQLSAKLYLGWSARGPRLSRVKLQRQKRIRNLDHARPNYILALHSLSMPC